MCILSHALYLGTTLYKVFLGSLTLFVKSFSFISLFYFPISSLFLLIFLSSSLFISFLSFFTLFVSYTYMYYYKILCQIFPLHLYLQIHPFLLLFHIICILYSLKLSSFYLHNISSVFLLASGSSTFLHRPPFILRTW